MDFSGEIKVSPVQDEYALREFLRFPWQIYQQDPYWVPPLLKHQRDFLDSRKGPFFEIGEAQYFLAFQGGKLAGRISAHINRRYDVHHGPGTGFFGFFECIQERQVAAALFEAAADWLRSRGKQRIVGPLNFSIYDEMGLLVEGFDSMPAIFQTHNPPYYLDLLESLGFRKTMDWHALKMSKRENLEPSEMERRLQTILQKHGLTLRSYQHAEFTRRAEEVYEIFNESWSRNWGHVPVTRRQFETFLKELKPLLRPDLVNLILDGDQLVAFSIVIPDLNPLVQKLNGRLSLWGKLRLLYAAKYAPIRKARALVLGVLKPYQGKQLHYAMIMRSYLYMAYHTPVEVCDFSLIPENLRHYMKAFLAMGAERYKIFRVLEKEI